MLSKRNVGHFSEIGNIRNIGRPARKAAGALALMAIAISSVPVALAAPAFNKKERDLGEIKQTGLTKPAAPPEEKKNLGPVLTIDQFIDMKRAEIMKIVDKQIDQMSRLIKVTGDDDPQKPDFWFRLAELYAEKQRYYVFAAGTLEQKIFDAKPAEKKSLQDKQAKAKKLSEQYLVEAVKAYMGARQFKKFGRMDEVLFKLAFLLQTVKREDQAREVFHELIKDYPNSKYIPDAYLSFAEFYFAKQEMDAALKFYERVEQFPNSNVYGYAVYKKGWCWINLGDYKKALEIFVKVIKIAEGKKGGQWDALVRESKKDVVKAYARVGGPDKAWEFFRRVGGDYAPKMIEGLAEIYWEQGMFADSTMVLRQIISINPKSDRICEWQNKILRNTLSSGKKSDQVQEIERLGAAYRMVSQMPEAKKNVLEECKNAFHDTTKELALIWHKEAQKTKNQDTYKLVRFIYREYLKYFENEKGADDMLFYYAEVLWMTEQWREAADAYTQFVEKNPKHKDAKDAAYAAVLSWKNAIGQVGDMPPPKPKSGEDENKKLEIPDHQLKMLQAFDTYIKYVPDSEELPSIKYRKARIFYEYNHFEEAVPLFGDLVEHHRNTELGIFSANLLLDTLNILKRTKEILAWVDKFLKMPELMKDEEFAKQMISIKTDALVREAKEFEGQGKFKECAQSMVAAAETLPEHPEHPTRLYDAALCFQNARLVGQAIRFRQELIEKYPTNPLSQRALYQIASGFHQLAYYSRASEFYEQYANKFPGESQSPKALGNAAVFRMGLGEYEAATKDMNAYIKYYGAQEPEDSAAVFFQMGQIFEKENRKADLLKHLQDYLKKWGKKGGVDKEIVAHFRIGEMLWQQSCPVDGVNGACIEVKRVDVSGRAKAFDKLRRDAKKKGKKVALPKSTQCGPPTSTKVTVHERKASLAKEALKHFELAIKLFDKGESLEKIPAEGSEKVERAGLATYAAAGSAFYQAEEQYEKFLRIEFPKDLDFQQPNDYYTPKQQKSMKAKFEDSTKRFNKYFEEKSVLTLKLAGDPAKNLQGLYERVFPFKIAHWTIASAARVGQVWQNFADQMYTAEIPKDLKEEDSWGNRPREIYCDALMDKGEPIESKGVLGFEVCLKGATEQSWFNDWSRLCEVELSQMMPSDYPLASEMKPEAGYMATVMSPAPLLSELPEESKAISVAAPE